MKLAVFDFDSTLMDGETLEFLAKEFNLDKKIKAITDKAMEGKLDFFESLTERVALLKGLPFDRADKICRELPLMNGAKETISELNKAGFTTICFSGGFKIATVPAKEILGLKAEFANILHFKDGLMTGRVGGEMMFSDSKGTMLKTIQELLGVTKENTVATGDGANDLSMFKYAAARVSFLGKPVLRKEANIIIEKKDLTELIEPVMKLIR